MLTPKTCRAARALLNWSQSVLARKAKLGLSTVYEFEKEHRETSPESVEAIERALVAAGIELFNHGSPGARLHPKRSKAK